MNAATLDKMRKMKLQGMYRVFKTSLESEKPETYTPDELIAHLVDAEWDDRQNRSIDQKVKNARFRYKADLEGLYYHSDRNIDRNQIMRLAECSFIDKAECVLVTGSTGIGKSYIASALGHHACSRGYRVVYHNVPKLFSKLKMSKADGSYIKEIARIERQQLLILDDFGLQPLDAQSRTVLMELVEDRHGKSALIITSQVPVSKWYDIIGEQTIADAILDRIVHHAHRLELKGESLRKRRKADNEPNT
ncbi:ATP-binding protein [Terrimonas sp.]|uniref:IS21-like element helper ATPase IstB n=1 Tax=Terrimonas sp. TaxID=1914338 RepID=UPI000D51DB90|nr:IS21-like element helper ATPase IstB [Terrimonas sp.]PVD50407.1 ATP-binding protein [Terrimonas sp.]